MKRNSSHQCGSSLMRCSEKDFPSSPFDHRRHKRLRNLVTFGCSCESFSALWAHRLSYYQLAEKYNVKLFWQGARVSKVAQPQARSPSKGPRRCTGKNV